MWNLKIKVKFIEIESAEVVAKAGGEENGERLVKGYKWSALRLIRSENLMCKNQSFIILLFEIGVFSGKLNFLSHF